MGSNLRHLEASSCGITAKGAALLQEALDGGSPLVSLKLQGNSISDEGAASLGAALTKGAALQELNISNNQVSSCVEMCSVYYHTTSQHVLCKV